jgi:hypothetical protein
MTKSTLKAIILTTVICFSTLISKAQLGHDYAQYDIGFGASGDQVYGDAQTVKLTPSAHFNLSYNASPFVNFVFDINVGKLQGGNAAKDSSGRQFSNSFTALSFRGQLQLGEIMDYADKQIPNAFKNLYISTGVGYIVNNVTANRYSIKIPGFYTPGDNHSTEIYIPLRIGYEFKMFNAYNEPSVKIDLAYQYNLVLGDDLDGFIAGTSNDKFSQISLGVKFAIGAVTSYRKQIYY